MLPALKGFDPLYYFDIDTTGMNQLEVNRIREYLIQKLSEYIVFHLSKQLTADQQLVVFQIEHGEDLLQVLGNSIPDLEEQILTQIEQFKREFQKTN